MMSPLRYLLRLILVRSPNHTGRAEEEVLSSKKIRAESEINSPNFDRIITEMAPSYAYKWFEGTTRTAYRLLAETALEVPEKTAIICGDQRLTYGAFFNKVETAADFYLDKGLGKDDRILVVLANSPEFLIVQYSCSKSGVIPCLLSPIASEQEISAALKTVKPKGAIFSKGFPHKHLFDCLSVVMEIDEIYGKTAAEAKETTVPSDVWLMLFTSGTTGPAKAVPVKYTSVLTSAIFTTKCTRALSTCGQTCMVPVPLSHVLGAGGTSMVFMNRGTVVLLSGRYSSSNVERLIEEERVSLIFGVPVMFLDLLNRTAQNPQATNSLKGVICGGAVVPPALIKALQKRDIVLTEVYGSTEIGGSVVATEHFPEGSKTSVLGEIRLMGGNNNKEVVERNTKGEVCVRGQTVFSGYFGMDETKAQCMEESWYHTGDLGIMYSDGRLEICGRIKDLVIRGGENISPAEVETAIEAHPQVLQCAVFGVPDERMGEELAAWIVLKSKDQDLSADDIRKYLAQKLAPYKIPRHVFIVENLLRTASGKPVKFKMVTETLRKLQI